MEKKGIKEQIIDFIYGLDSRPNYIGKECIDVLHGRNFIDIVMNKYYHIELDLNGPYGDVSYAEEGFGYGKSDLEYAVEIMDNRNEIIEMAEKWTEIVSQMGL